MNNCIAAATQTGTCILEGVSRKKPVLVTSSGYSWKGIPYTFEILDENQGAEIIQSILDGLDWNDNEILAVTG